MAHKADVQDLYRLRPGRMPGWRRCDGARTNLDRVREPVSTLPTQSVLILRVKFILDSMMNRYAILGPATQC
jgi:hypothetical protein